MNYNISRYHKLNIQKAVFSSSDDSIKFKILSKPHTASKPVSLVVARHDSFRAYDLILDAAKGNFNNIKTIIIDDFDELINQWEKSDNCEEELRNIKDIYFNKVRNKKIKDLYLISENSSITIHNILKRNGIDYNSWLLKPLEEFQINHDENSNINPEINISNIGDDNFELLNDKLNILINKWRILAQSCFCSGEILKPINSLYELRTKLNSFFDPISMDQFINLLLKTLDQIQIKWFTAGQDYNTIKETKKYITDNFQNTSKPTNFKLKFLLEFLREKNIQDQSIIVSDNNNSEDINWMSMFIKSEYPGILLTHYHKKDYFILMHNTRTPVSVIFYLTSDKKIIGLAASNILANKQVFILNNKAYSHIELYFKFI